MLVGSIGIKNIDLINKKANLGYWIGEQYWGRGIIIKHYILCNAGIATNDYSGTTIAIWC